MAWRDDLAGMRERDRHASTCLRSHQAFALAPVRGRRFRVYTNAPGFRPVYRDREASACMRRHWTFALARVGIRGGRYLPGCGSGVSAADRVWYARWKRYFDVMW